MVRKRQEAKTFEKIGRATHAAKNRPAVDMPMKGAKLNSHNTTLGQVNQTERPQSIESMKAEGVAAQPAQPKYTGSRGPVRGNNAPGPGITRPTGQGRSIHMNGPNGRVEARDAADAARNKTGSASKKVENKKNPSFGTNFGLREYEVDEKTYNAGLTGAEVMATTMTGVGLARGAYGAYKAFRAGQAAIPVLSGEIGTITASQTARQTGQGAMRQIAEVGTRRASNLPRPNPIGSPGRSASSRSLAGSQTRPGVNVGQNTVTRPSSGAGNPFTQNPTRPAGSQTQIEKMADSVTKLKNTNKFNEAARRGGERVTGSSTAYPGLPLAKRLPQGSKSYPKPGNVINGRGNTWW